MVFPSIYGLVQTDRSSILSIPVHRIHEDISERKSYPEELATPGISGVREECLPISFKDTTEPIYTDLSLFERSRSLRSLSFNNERINDH